jgi:hypothetical protein
VSNDVLAVMNVTGEAFELGALNRGARDRSIEREALKIRGERLRCGGTSP